MVYFAYDGAIHGDWVSHYAIRLAARHPSGDLHLIHVDEQRAAPQDIQERLSQIATRCQRHGVRLHAEVCPLAGDVFSTLRARIPAQSDTLVICGTRTRRGGRGLLTGTVSDRLLKSEGRQVLAVRVVQPGLLGLSHDLLLPVSGRAEGFRRGLPILKLFAADLRRIHILHVRRVPRWRFRVLTAESVERLTRRGVEYCRRVESEIGRDLGLESVFLDASTVVSDDVPKEIVIFANKIKAQMILLGASERTLPQRFVYGNPLEEILRDATCDVAIYRGAP
jgi:nucleotide-binding universal stress UspA family protein